MGYITGSVDNSATPAVGVREALEAELTAVGFTLADTWGTGSQAMRIWQSPSVAYEGGATPRSAPWYLCIQLSSDTVFLVGACEEIDTTNNNMTKYCAAGSRSEGANADGTINLAAAAYLDLNYMAYWHPGTPFSTTTAPYWFVVTPECVLGAVDQSSYPFYAGYYEPMKDGITNHVPLCLLSSWGYGLSSSNNSYGGLSRLPEIAGTDPGNYLWHAQSNGGASFAPTESYGGVDAPHPLYTNLALGGRMMVVNPASMTYASIEHVRGMLRYGRYIRVKTSSNLARGDTVSDGTDTYVCLFPGYSIWMKTTNLGTT